MAVLVLVLGFTATACRGQDAGMNGLQATVDSLLPTLERLSGLDARQPVRVGRQDRAAMRGYVERQIAEELTAADLAGLEAAYREFGILPDTLDLERVLLDLYTEQIVGYYDPEAETLYVVEGVSREGYRPVVAHELVHALQDQHADLDALIALDRGTDERAAAQAAIEGHATLVMFALMAEETTNAPVDVETLPALGERLRPALEAQNEQFPVFRDAPRLIRETLLFPYLQGAAFVQALWRAAEHQGAGTPRPAPLDTLLPLSTEQVLHPRTHFLAGVDTPTRVILEPPSADGTDADAWELVYQNNLGELETGILLSEHLGAGADTLARGWDGDRYLLVEADGGGRALLWYSVWDDPGSADTFAAAYRRILTARPDRRGRVQRMDIDGRPVVGIVDAGRDLPPDRLPAPAAVRLAGFQDADE